MKAEPIFKLHPLLVDILLTQMAFPFQKSFPCNTVTLYAVYGPHGSAEQLKVLSSLK